MNFFFKIGVPSWEEAPSWGDYHLARALARELEKRGHRVGIQILPEWKGADDALSDVTIHIKGLSRYKPKRGPLNLMWLISHPDGVTMRELKRYDLVLVASRPFARRLREKCRVPVRTLLQFADSDLMYPDPGEETGCQLLFLGNSRRVRRRIISDLLPTIADLHVWGSDWENFIPGRYIKGRYFPYEHARKLYSTARIVLNDHWDDMRDNGFINNRIFDALACRAFVLSDWCDDLDNLLHHCVVTYRGKEDLHEKIAYYLDHEAERGEIASRGYEMAAGRHSVAARVDDLLRIIRERTGTMGGDDTAKGPIS